MRLRHRLQDELRRRLALHLPDALATVWDHQAVVVAVERLTFKPAGGWCGDWAYLTAFSGAVHAELRGNDVDELPVEPLLSDLIADPILLLPVSGTPTGATTETARAVLIEMRDVVRDQHVVSALRFEVEGHILGRAPDPGRPNAPMLGQAPRSAPAIKATISRSGADHDEIL